MQGLIWLPIIAIVHILSGGEFIHFDEIPFWPTDQVKQERVLGSIFQFVGFLSIIIMYLATRSYRKQKPSMSFFEHLEGQGK